MLRTRNAAAGALFGAILVVAAACTSGGGASTTSTSASSKAAVTSSTPAPRTSAKPTPAKPPTLVHVSLEASDGADFGVGIPIIVWFNRKPGDAIAFAKATKVTANGAPVDGSWYFEPTEHVYAGGPYNGKKAALEGHYRPRYYWPAHASIHMDLPIKGLSAGPGMVYDESYTLDFTTHAANIVTVNASTLMLTVQSDGAPALGGKAFLVSLGAPDTPTKAGIKVIMEKGASICMSGPGYNECGVKSTQRLTYDGEYLHAAPWNIRNLGVRSTSNGCTNLSPADALTLYGYLGIGDVVTYLGLNTARMQLGDGYGDWNVLWSVWQGGGALTTA